jgi:transcriptional repressor NrdR
MKCPFCGTTDSKVIDSRPSDESARIRRRRECLACQKRFTTYEIVETVPLMVVKKDKSREAFDREKLISGLMRASYKRPVSYQALENMVDSIEQKLMSDYEKEVTSIAIGELAMEQLQRVDEVAYVRFASVYRQFSDINTFMDELKSLLSSKDLGKF